MLVFFALVFLYPFILSFATTWKSRAEVAAHPVLPWPLDPSSRAWENILVHSEFPLWTLNSITVTVLATLLRLFLDSLAGYSLARLNWRGRGLVFAFVLGVLAVPPIVLTVPRFLVLKEMGLLNSYAGLVLPLAVDAVGIFIMKQFFEAMPAELEEAARIDGAGIFRTFWSIMLPLARPGLITLAILSFQGTWNEFLLPLIVVRGRAGAVDAALRALDAGPRRRGRPDLRLPGDARRFHAHHPPVGYRVHCAATFLHSRGDVRCRQRGECEESREA